ncbi:hypothetical protein APY04_1047 [Hyphomicrobium sulfonivorans]|uniref:Uncharacterized protein n=1 Tax=Hyphomicrobium sulfonivorans TaxID=121290 RepID=A0A109BKX6_HYPSL|nr:hypothetical protein APY04_1047 [Hyphomicrobium sulfonivorans]
MMTQQRPGTPSGFIDPSSPPQSVRGRQALHSADTVTAPEPDT